MASRGRAGRGAPGSVLERLREMNAAAVAAAGGAAAAERGGGGNESSSSASGGGGGGKGNLNVDMLVRVARLQQKIQGENSKLRTHSCHATRQSARRSVPSIDFQRLQIAPCSSAPPTREHCSTVHTGLCNWAVDFPPIDCTALFFFFPD
jgi:hypothetical protein